MNLQQSLQVTSTLGEFDSHLLLALLVMVMAGGVGDWKTLANINDPLPQAMKAVVGENSGWVPFAGGVTVQVTQG